MIDCFSSEIKFRSVSETISSSTIFEDEHKTTAITFYALKSERVLAIQIARLIAENTLHFSFYRPGFVDNTSLFWLCTWWSFRWRSFCLIQNISVIHFRGKQEMSICMFFSQCATCFKIWIAHLQEQNKILHHAGPRGDLHLICKLCAKDHRGCTVKWNFSLIGETNFSYHPFTGEERIQMKPSRDIIVTNIAQLKLRKLENSKECFAEISKTSEKNWQKHGHFTWNANQTRKANYSRNEDTPLLSFKEHEKFSPGFDTKLSHYRDCITRKRSACHANDHCLLHWSSIITTYSSSIEVIKTEYSIANYIIYILAGTAASRDETPCIRSTHNNIVALGPCTLQENTHNLHSAKRLRRWNVR